MGVLQSKGRTSTLTVVSGTSNHRKDSCPPPNLDRNCIQSTASAPTLTVVSGISNYHTGPQHPPEDRSCIERDNGNSRRLMEEGAVGRNGNAPPVQWSLGVPFADRPIREMSRLTFRTLDMFLDVDRATEVNYIASRSKDRLKLTHLTNEQFYELSKDIFEEVVRRYCARHVPCLPMKEDFPTRRNHFRQNLATQPDSDFEDFLSDVHFELARRYPECKEDAGTSDNLCHQMVTEDLRTALSNDEGVSTAVEWMEDCQWWRQAVVDTLQKVHTCLNGRCD
ncbi:hypothetical protein PM082_003857 [Marasmius tenuissimus]|nr:hypothetical protein PM082_003857 [Marasmius tenuissimus]